MANHTTSIVARTSATTPASSVTVTTELFRIWEVQWIQEGKKDNLRLEAQRFFQSLAASTRVEVASTVVLQTKPSHEEALALLVQQFHDPLTTGPVSARVAALYGLIGAVEGCRSVTLSFALIDLLGNFFVTHCAPFSDNDSEVRDAAVLALTVLMKSQSSDSDNVGSHAQVLLTLARKAVESRCSVDEGEVDTWGLTQHQDSRTIEQRRLQMGLSSLPRSRRSHCFDLLRSAVASVEFLRVTTTSLDENFSRHCVEFCVFASSCLMGESDPRCLLQLLELFHSMGNVFSFLHAAFPWDQVLDTVSPYYPIQFTPPPNNIHQITKQQLRHALIQVFDACQHQETVSNVMFMVLDRILPEEGDDVTLEEKCDSLEDIDNLLFCRNDGASSEVTTKLGLVDGNSVRQLSGALLSLFREASLKVVRASDDSLSHLSGKRTVDACRRLVAKVARECETVHWDAFVGEPLQTLSRKLHEPCRISVAYMACLASCGGPKTLRRALEAGLAPLLESKSFDDVATAVYGVGAFFSACDTSVHMAESRGIFLYPHPIKSYRAQAIRKLDQLVVHPKNDEDERHNSSASLQIAAVRALESVLLASPALHSGDDEVECVSNFIQFILDPILLSNSREPSAEIAWLSTCAKTVGSLLGRSLAGKEGKHSKIEYFLECERMMALFDIEVLPKLMESVTSENMPASIRFDRQALATACSLRGLSASRVVGGVVATMGGALKVGDSMRAASCASTLKTIFRIAGPVSAKAFHSLTAPSLAPFELIDLLISDASGNKAWRSSQGMESSFGTSLVKLPTTEEDLRKLNLSLSNAYRLSLHLRPAYDFALDADQFSRFLTLTANTLPPLNDADSMKLAVVLPLLSATVGAWPSLSIGLLDSATLKSLLSDLSEFMLNSNQYPPSRKHASLCLKGLICAFAAIDDLCPVNDVLKKAIVPTLRKVVQLSMEKDERSLREARVAEGLPLITEILEIISLLGSAAAYRSFSSAVTADRLVSFCFDVACSDQALLLLSDNESVTFDFDTLGDNGEAWEESRIDIVNAAASSMGAILSAAMSDLSKQRLTTLALKRLEQFTTLRHDASIRTYGAITAACQMACACNLQVMNTESRMRVANMVLSGFHTNAWPGERSRGHGSSHRKLQLAATLKLLVAARSELTGQAALLLNGTLRCFAEEPEPTSNVATKLLALQVLETLARPDLGYLEIGRLKPAVVSILSGAMNHPSSLIRQAAADVRNVWCTVGEL